MRVTQRTLLLGGSALMLLLIAISIGLIYAQQKNKPALSPEPAASGTLTPAISLTPTATRNVDFLPLVGKQPTDTPTPTPTLTPTPTVTPTPTITPTPTPLTLSFCDQSPGPLVIQDYATITDTLTIDFPGTILDLDVSVNVSHGYSGDLEITLLSQDDVQADLINRPGAPPNYCPQDNIEATFDDEALLIGNQQCAAQPPAVAGQVRPLSPLYVFDQTLISGSWKLVVADKSSPDEGSLNQWCLVATLR